LTIWVPVQLHVWFMDYWNRVSYGSNFSEKIRVLLCRLPELDEAGITRCMLSSACIHHSLIHIHIFLSVVNLKSGFFRARAQNHMNRFLMLHGSSTRMEYENLVEIRTLSKKRVAYAITQRGRTILNTSGKKK